MKKMIGKKSILVLMVLALTLVFILPVMAAAPGFDYKLKSMTGGGFIDSANFGFNLMIIDEKTLDVNFHAICEDTTLGTVTIKANDIGYITGINEDYLNDNTAIRFRAPAQIKIENGQWEPNDIEVVVWDNDSAGDKISIRIIGKASIPTTELEGGNIQAHYAKVKP
jgi:hypothetical protein